MAHFTVPLRNEHIINQPNHNVLRSSVVASIICELGVPHEVECLTEDGYFSVDVYLPQNGVAIEVDGPTHFIIADTGEGGALGDANRTGGGWCARSCATCF